MKVETSARFLFVPVLSAQPLGQRICCRHKPPARLAHHRRQAFFSAVLRDLPDEREFVPAAEKLSPTLWPHLVGLFPEATVNKFARCVLLYAGVGQERVMLHLPFGDKPRAFPQRQVPRVRVGFQGYKTGGAVAALRHRLEQAFYRAGDALRPKLTA